MNTIKPKQVRLIGLLANELSFDNYVHKNQTFSTIMFVQDNPLIEHTLLHHFGKMDITVLYKTFVLNSVNTGYQLPDNWLLLLSSHFYDCYRSLGSIDNILQIYMQRNCKWLKEIQTKIINEISKGYFITAQTQLFELLTQIKNLYEQEQFNSDRKLSYLLANFIMHDFKATNITLDNKPYIQSKHFNPKSEFQFIYNGIKPNKYYYLPITQIVEPYENEFPINPLIVFVEHIYNREDIEKVLEILENGITLLLLNDIDDNSYAKILFELWYTSLKLTYETQKDKNTIKIVQPYLPYMQARLESQLTGKDYLTSEHNIHPVRSPIPFLVMPISVYVEILSLLTDSKLKEFVDFLDNMAKRVNYEVYVYSQLVASYYSSFLSEMFDCIINKLPCKQEDWFKFEILLRLLLSTVERVHYTRTETDINRYYKTHKVYKFLKDRITNDHILLVHKTLYDYDLQQNTIKYVLDNRLGYTVMNTSKKFSNLSPIIIEDFMQYIPSVYISALEDRLFKLSISIITGKALF